MDYLGEPGIGRPHYAGRDNDGGALANFPWIASWAGDIDITGGDAPRPTTARSCSVCDRIPTSRSEILRAYGLGEARAVVMDRQLRKLDVAGIGGRAGGDRGVQRCRRSRTAHKRRVGGGAALRAGKPVPSGFLDYVCPGTVEAVALRGDRQGGIVIAPDGRSISSDRHRTDRTHVTRMALTSPISMSRSWMRTARSQATTRNSSRSRCGAGRMLRIRVGGALHRRVVRRRATTRVPRPCPRRRAADAHGRIDVTVRGRHLGDATASLEVLAATPARVGRSMNSTPTSDLLRRCPIIPVVVLDDPARAGDVVSALLEGGIRCAEITLRTPVALAAIEAAVTQDFVVGAGTVLTGNRSTPRPTRGRPSSSAPASMTRWSNVL